MENSKLLWLLRLCILPGSHSPFQKHKRFFSQGFPDSPVVKNLLCNARGTGSTVVWEDPTCRGITKSVAIMTEHSRAHSHSYWSLLPRAYAPPQEKPLQWETFFPFTEDASSLLPSLLGSQGVIWFHDWGGFFVSGVVNNLLVLNFIFTLPSEVSGVPNAKAFDVLLYTHIWLSLSFLLFA